MTPLARCPHKIECISMDHGGLITVECEAPLAIIIGERVIVERCELGHIASIRPVLKPATSWWTGWNEELGGYHV